jgi:hypothetical protein
MDGGRMSLSRSKTLGRQLDCDRMPKGKGRLTVTVDRELVRVGTAAVREGRARSLSGWVNLALAERAEKERRLKLMEQAIEPYESEFGTITTEELMLQERADRGSAIVVRSQRRPRRRKAPP